MDKFFHNGNLISTPVGIPHPEALLHSNYVYAAVNTTVHEPLYLAEHLATASNSYEKLYGQKFICQTEDIRHQIKLLLAENNMTRMGNIVNIYFIPPEHQTDDKPEILISWYRSTIYKGYELISLRPKAMLVNYEIPFSGHRTAISLTASEYMQQFAQRAGSHIALHANRAEKLVSCGDYPVFVVIDGVVVIPTAAESVERSLMLRACHLSKTTTEEREISVEELTSADEIMVFNHTGIQSILSLGDRYFYNITAMRLEKTLRQITEEGISI